MNVDLYVAGIIVTLVIFATYALARRRADTGSARFQWVNAWIRPGAGRLIIPFLAAWVVIAAIDYSTGGALSRPDRFWAGLALGVGLGALVVTVIARRRADG